jgi:dipeptidyl aminopeptidase/acylaminoacyl peptidase
MTRLSALLLLAACSNPERGLALADIALLDAIEAANAALVEPVAGFGAPRWLGSGRVAHAEPSDDGPIIAVYDADSGARANWAEGTSPVPSPDGSRVAAVDRRGRLIVLDDEGAEVARTRIALGIAADVAPIGGAAPIVWAADSARFAALETRDRRGSLRTTIVVCDRDGAPEAELDLGVHAIGVDWLPDGRLAAVLVDLVGGLASTLVIVDVAAGRADPIGPPLGSALLAPRVVDGAIAVAVDRIEGGGALRPVQLEIVLVDPATGATTPMTDERTHLWYDAPIAKTPDGDLLIATRRPTLPYAVQRVTTDGGVTSERRLAIQAIGGLDVSGDGERAVWIGRDLDGSASLRWAPTTTFSERDLAGLTPGGGAELPLADVAELLWETTDGFPLGGLLLTDPSASGPRPLWVDVHGGPEGGIGLDGALFRATPLEWHHRVRDGFTVLVVDHRSGGVAGLGARRPDDRAIPVAEVDDVLGGIDAAIARAEIDPDRIVIAGHGWGGAVALHAIALSDRFAAAIVLSSPLVAADDVQRASASFAWLYGDVPEVALPAFEASYPHLNPGSTPTLLLSGRSARDGGTTAQHRAYAEAVDDAGGGPVEVVTVRGEGFTFTSRRANAEVLTAVARFLDETIGPR